MTDSENKRVVEVDGVKLEIDLRTAKRVDTLRVGDRVKVLIKPSYGSMEIRPGVVVGFEPFKSLPTIIVAYVKKDFTKASVEHLYFNAESKDAEVIAAVDDDAVSLDKQDVVDRFDLEIQKKREEIDEIERRKMYFLRNFQRYWVETDVAAATEEGPF